jgi:hypothetical protein
MRECVPWDYVIDRIAFTTARLTGVSVTLKNALPDLAPF